MAIDLPKQQVPKPKSSVIRWLLDSDPSIRWQVLRDCTDTSAAVVTAERSRVALEGWGRRLLDQQRSDGQWGDGVTTPFFEGEVEPCINGRVVALGGYFGERSDALVNRLLSEQLED